MNIKILDSWIREYLKSKVTPLELQKLLSLSGPAVERITPQGKDLIYELEVTNNRLDTASVYGLAREAKTILNYSNIPAQLKPLTVASVSQALPEIAVTIVDPSKLTQRLLAVVLELPNGKTPSSPTWLKERLAAAGVRSLNFLIDITNYVMLEVGYPLHVFDYERLNTKKLVLRKAKTGERLTTLDGVEHQLSAEDVVIVDDQERIVDLPGIMGCKNSVVNASTKKILLFAEVNDPVRIRRSSMRLGIRTLAATYNENSPDSQLALLAICRALALYTQAGVKLVSRIFDSNPKQRTLPEISLNLADLERYMNLKINPEEVIRILEDLEIKLVSTSQGEYRFQIPSFREKDIQIKEDLIEEVARIYGYGKIPTILPPFQFISDPYIRQNEAKYKIESRLKGLLANLGYFEIYNYSMISEKQNLLFALPKNSIRMINPMSQELVYFRQSLLPSLLHNAWQNRGLPSLRLFEIANVYLPQVNSLPHEQLTLGVLLKGEYAQLKGILEVVLKSGFLNPDFLPKADQSIFDAQQSAKIMLQDSQIGVIGKLAPKLVYDVGLKAEFVALELNLEAVIKHYQAQAPLPELNNKPELIEDLTYKLSSSTNWSELVRALLAQFKELKRVAYLGIYQDYVTMRLFSQPKSGKSLLGELSLYLEKTFALQIKRPKADSSK